MLRIPDMNDESNLELYSKLLLFKNDLSRDEILWPHPENTLQRTLQSLAHRLNLEYEFSLGAQVARVSRPSLSMDIRSGNFEFLDFGSFEDDHSFPGGEFGLSNAHYSHVRKAELSASLPHTDPLPDTPFSTALDSSPSFLDLSKWSNHESNSFFADMPTKVPPAESELQLFDLSTDGLHHPQSPFSPWYRQFGAPVSPGTDSNRGSSQPQMSPTALPNLPSFQSRLQKIVGSTSTRLEDIARSEPSKKVLPASDVDMDDSDDSMERQRFYCTDYPPCSLSFTRSEHLARHIR